MPGAGEDWIGLALEQWDWCGWRETRRARAVEETRGAFPTRMTMQKVSGILNALHYICNILTDSTGVWNHE